MPLFLISLIGLYISKIICSIIIISFWGGIIYLCIFLVPFASLWLLIFLFLFHFVHSNYPHFYFLWCLYSVIYSFQFCLHSVQFCHQFCFYFFLTSSNCYFIFFSAFAISFLTFCILSSWYFFKRFFSRVLFFWKSIVFWWSNSYLFLLQ